MSLGNAQRQPRRCLLSQYERILVRVVVTKDVERSKIGGNGRSLSSRHRAKGTRRENHQGGSHRSSAVVGGNQEEKGAFGRPTFQILQEFRAFATSSRTLLGHHTPPAFSSYSRQLGRPGLPNLPVGNHILRQLMRLSRPGDASRTSPATWPWARIHLGAALHQRQKQKRPEYDRPELRRTEQFNELHHLRGVSMSGWRVDWLASARSRPSLESLAGRLPPGRWQVS